MLLQSNEEQDGEDLIEGVGFPHRSKMTRQSQW